MNNETNNNLNSAIQVNELEGVYAAVITPLKTGNGLNNRVDYDKLHMLIDDLISSGITGIVACGTTGQSSTLSHKEHVNLAERIFRYINNRVQFIAGAGSNCTRESIELSKKIESRIGPTTFLQVTGYYNNPPQLGIIRHFTELTDAISDQSNIILYNVPGRTGSNIESDTVVELSENPKIIGIKECSGNLSQVHRIIDNTNPSEFRVLSGECRLTSEICQMGGFGVISATANIAPRYFLRILKAAKKEDYELSMRIQEEILPLINFVFSAKNPIPLAHIFDTELRLPLTKLDRIENNVENILSQYTPNQLGINYHKYRRN